MGGVDGRVSYEVDRRRLGTEACSSGWVGSRVAYEMPSPGVGTS